jgi:hypothetical protein
VVCAAQLGVCSCWYCALKDHAFVASSGCDVCSQLELAGMQHAASDANAQESEGQVLGALICTDVLLYRSSGRHLSKYDKQQALCLQARRYK